MSVAATSAGIVAEREEAVGDGAERLAQPVAVGEAGADQRHRPARRAPPRRRTPRRAARAACRARTACRPPPSRNSRSYVDVVAEHGADDRLDRPPGVWPGSSRQSTSISQSAGMTFRFREAEIIVGENVGASSGSTSSADRRVAARARARRRPRRGGTSPSTARRNASTSCWICGSGRYAAIRSISLAALTSALSAIPASTRGRRGRARGCVNGAVIFSAVAAT